MVLVDTSVWVEHLRRGATGLETALNEGQVFCHPFIVGELVCGNLRNRAEVLTLLKTLPEAHPANNEEVLHFIEQNRLMGKGLGYVDMHLMASAALTNVRLWTLDKRLHRITSALRLAW